MKLCVISGGDKGLSFALDQEVLVIGRGEDCEVCLKDKRSSRKHAKMTLEDGQVYLEDLGSTNGSYVNNRKISEKTLLKLEDRLRIGETSLQLLQDSAQADSQNSASCHPETRILGKEQLLALNILEDAKQDSQNFVVHDSLNLKTDKYLNLLHEISQKISSDLDLNSVLDKSMDVLLELLNVERGFIMLYDQNMELQPKVSKSKTGKSSQIQVSQTILNIVGKEGKALMSNNAASDSRLQGAESVMAFDIRAALCAPLSHNDKVRGLVYVDCQGIDRDFQESDLELLSVIANQLAIAIENARLFTELKEMMIYNQNIIEAMGCALIVLDQELSVVEMNPQAEKLLNCQKNDAWGQNCKYLGKQHEFFEHVSNAYEQKNFSQSFSIQTEQQQYFELSLTPSVSGLTIISFVDMTNFVQLNQRLQRSEKLAAFGKMVSYIGHEIKNPLNSIRGFIQVMQIKEPTPEEKKKFEDIIIKEVDTINGFIGDMLSLSRQKELDLKPLQLVDFLKDIIFFVGPEIVDKGISIEENYPEFPLLIQADEIQLKQVLLNVIRNAMESYQDSYHSETKLIQLNIIDQQDEICIQICDNGPGIDSAAQEKIFNPFFTSKPKGTGLGLPICQKIIEQHGGFLTAENIQPHGAMFSICLPKELKEQ